MIEIIQGLPHVFVGFCVIVTLLGVAGIMLPNAIRAIAFIIVALLVALVITSAIGWVVALVVAGLVIKFFEWCSSK